MSVVVFDFESYWSDDCSISAGLTNYVDNPEFDCFLVSFAGDDGWEWVGHPSEAPWGMVRERYDLWVAWNAGFDMGLLERFCDRPARFPWFRRGLMPRDWNCAANLSAFHGFPRSLKGAAETILGVQVDKDPRDQMKGRTFASLTDEKRKRFTDYCMDDSRLALRVWGKLAAGWPDTERALSKQSYRLGWKGVPVDIEAVRAGVARLTDLKWELERKIPWAADDKPTSPKAVAAYCAKAGLVPPRSMDKRDDEFIAWLDANGEANPWVQAIRDWRSVNPLLSRLTAMEKRTRDDGWMEFDWKYFGAHTGRWSSGGEDEDERGVNLLNQPREKMFGIDVRGLVRAKDGHVLVGADASQIEPRCLHWLVGDTAMLELAKRMDWYEAQASGWGIHKPGEPFKGTEKRTLTKALNLGCGYRMSAAKFAKTAKVEESEAARMVALYRKLNPRIAGPTGIWRTFDRQLEAAAGGDLVLVLPSGRESVYRDVTRKPSTKFAGMFEKEVTMCWRGKMHKRFMHGGLLTEHLCVSGDAEVFSESRGWVRLDSIRRDERVWDGEGFVAHGGLVAKGRKAVVDCHGVAATPDHLFLTEGGTWSEARNLCAGDAPGEANVFDILDCGPRNRFAVRGGRGLPVLIAHNCQATGRDILAGVALECERRGIDLLWHVYDEIIADCRQEDVADVSREIEEMMTATPEWAPGLPLGTEVHVMDRYRKN